MGNKTAALIGCLVVAACAGGFPADRDMNCAAIFAEVQTNNAKLQEMGVVGLVIWPIWFDVDSQGTANTEVTAINSRQQYLAALARRVPRLSSRPSFFHPNTNRRM
jgi:hypothetical protein